MTSKMSVGKYISLLGPKWDNSEGCSALSPKVFWQGGTWLWIVGKYLSACCLFWRCSQGTSREMRSEIGEGKYPVVQITLVNNLGSVLLGTSGIQCRTCLRLVPTKPRKVVHLCINAHWSRQRVDPGRCGLPGTSTMHHAEAGQTAVSREAESMC